MNVKVVAGSTAAIALMGLGILTGSVIGTGAASAQTAAASAAATDAPAQQAQASPKATVQAAITQQQAEQAALAAGPGNTVDHTQLFNQNGTAVYDVDFANGGGVTVNGQTGAVIASEAAGTDQGGHRGGHGTTHP